MDRWRTATHEPTKEKHSAGSKEETKENAPMTFILIIARVLFAIGAALLLSLFSAGVFYAVCLIIDWMDKTAVSRET